MVILLRSLHSHVLLLRLNPVLTDAVVDSVSRLVCALASTSTSIDTRLSKLYGVDGVASWAVLIGYQPFL